MNLNFWKNYDRKKKKHWLIGILMATVGVTLAKVTSAFFDGPTKLIITIIGINFCFIGLFIIAFGLREKK